MEHQESTFTSREGEKIRFAPPPPDIEKQVRERQAEDFKQAQELLKGLKPKRDAETLERKRAA